MKLNFLSSVIFIFALLFMAGCTPEAEENRDSGTIFDPQIQALEKAKQVEGDLIEAQQEREKQMRDQGL